MKTKNRVPYMSHLISELYGYILLLCSASVECSEVKYQTVQESMCAGRARNTRAAKLPEAAQCVLHGTLVIEVQHRTTGDPPHIRGRCIGFHVVSEFFRDLIHTFRGGHPEKYLFVRATLSISEGFMPTVESDIRRVTCRYKTHTLVAGGRQSA